MMRMMLYEAAQSMLRSKKWSWLKAWVMQIARRRGMKKAIVALARRLAVIMHRIWVDGTEFRWTREAAPLRARATERETRSLRIWISSSHGSPKALTACSARKASRPFSASLPPGLHNHRRT
jgi:hypothetical protein